MEGISEKTSLHNLLFKTEFFMGSAVRTNGISGKETSNNTHYIHQTEKIKYKRNFADIKFGKKSARVMNKYKK